MEVSKKKIEEETERLKQELQDLQVGFATQKEQLEAEYQKQVDDMSFYGYQCCMKKHGIAHDTPNFPSDDENEALSGPARGRGNASKAGPSSEQA